jgi:hypothetical protein
LPWFGGSAAVWTTCLVFFQGALLAGYLYAHCLHARLGPRAQALVHGGALLASLPALGLLLAARPIPGLDGYPTLGVLGLLALTIGLPYGLLASTGPLLQAWLARRPGAPPPYRLFALSNLASLAALLGYPVLVEPAVPWRRQAAGWAALYAGFALLSGLAARRAGRGGPAGEAGDAEAGAPALRPDWAERGLWVGLAAGASLLLVAVTGHLTQHVAPAPLLWVVPLAVYLLSFVLCFEWPRLYFRPVWLPLLPAALAGLAYLARLELDRLGLLVRGGLFVAGLFACCMVCHGEIARRRPHVRHLTAYYLLVALGGALGGLLAGVVAPLVFVRLVELPAAMLLTGALGVLVSLRAIWPRAGAYGRLAAVAVLPFALGIYVTYVLEGARAATRSYGTMLRSFYGQLAVRHDGAREDPDASRTLVHGGIIHGTQWLHEARRRQPTTYYCENSGVGRALDLLPAERARRVGLVGLGVGTLAAYGRPGDLYRAYEINPQVVRLAQTEFTFLRDSAATVEIVLGDARLRMESEPPQGLDLLAVDAFSGDAIPTHLLTLEALALYVRHLAPAGILAVHVSNRFVELEPVLAAGAVALRRPAVSAVAEGDGERLCYNSQWILIPPRDGRRRYPALWEFGTRLEPTPGIRAWTDELWSLYPVLRTGVR